MDDTLKKALLETRAEILWGAKAEKLRENLTQEGLSDLQIIFRGLERLLEGGSAKGSVTEM